MARYLGIDVGGSATRWHLDKDCAEPRAGSSAGFSGHLFRTDVRDKAERTIAEISREIGAVDAIVAGVTGLIPPSPETDALTALLQKAFPSAAITVMTDSRLACLTAFAPGEGFLVYAGTGSVGAFIDTTGDQLLVGGKGVLIDDGGGGYWIAIRGLRALLRAEDAAPGSGWSSELGQAFAVRLQGNDWASLRKAVYSAERGEIGRLALAVADAAGAGDQTAIAVMRQAGAELAELARMLERRIGRHLPIKLAGRAGGLHPGILDSMQEALPGRDILRVELDCAAGAARLARSPALFAGQQRDKTIDF